MDETGVDETGVVETGGVDHACGHHHKDDGEHHLATDRAAHELLDGGVQGRLPRDRAEEIEDHEVRAEPVS